MEDPDPYFFSYPRIRIWIKIKWIQNSALKYLQKMEGVTTELNFTYSMH